MTLTNYKMRRALLTDRLENVSYAVTAFCAVQQTNDASAPFKQEANFWYLTGIDEPGWTLIVESDGKSTLISPDISEIHRIFDGGISDQLAQRISGVDEVVNKKDGDTLLDGILRAEKSIGVIANDPHEKYHSFEMNLGPKNLYSRLESKTEQLIDVRPILAKMRGIKSSEEIEIIRRAVNVTVGAFSIVKERLTAAHYEYNLDAEFTYAFRNCNATHAYEPIVAAGKNACTLHYQKNSARLPKNGLVLMDVGARIDGYCADITRTYAIGTPSKREVEVHAAVEKAHHEIIALIKPEQSVKEYQRRVNEIMEAALKGLGLLNKPEDFRKYFPHAISHGLGIDVHDPLGAPAVFMPGMVLTVEPGIYIPEEGIGVRIEDDILVTKTGNENLSGDLPTSL